MKSKSCILTLLALLILGLSTSCEDMFDIPSNRVVYDHEISSTADSAYTTLGVLSLMRKVADRYVILGELRGDLVQIDEDNTKASLRNLANFNFTEDNEYLNVRDYYNIINNCNYALANMDVSIKLHNEYVMMDEYAAMVSIRAWAYLQLAINYGEVYYYTYPVISEADVQRVKEEGKKDIKYIAADLAPQMLPYLDTNMPSFVNTTGLYPNMRLVLAELYLWSGDYENAAKLYEDYFMHNDKYQLVKNDAESEQRAEEPGYFEFTGAFGTWDGKINTVNTNLNRPDISRSDAKEFISGISMGGTTSEVPSLFHKGSDGESEIPPVLKVSGAYDELCKEQKVFNASGTGNKITLKVDSVVLGDMRRYAYEGKTSIKDEMTGLSQEYDTYVKHSSNQIVIQRYPIACLRWAEAMNAWAGEMYVPGDSAIEAKSRQLAENSFNLLKDAFKVFFPDSTDVWTRFEYFHDGLKKSYIGIHARGAGDVRHDTTYYVLKPAVIAKRLGKDVNTPLNFNDTIQYIDELIIDELALESTLEGNRFGDLIRFADRRKDVDFLAKRVAARKGKDEFDQALYEKLTDRSNWYLPLFDE